MKYTKLLDTLVLQTIREVTITNRRLPFLIPTKTILNDLIPLWKEKGYSNVEMNVQKVGMAMRRLGFEPYADGVIRRWTIDEETLGEAEKDCSRMA